MMVVLGVSPLLLLGLWIPDLLPLSRQEMSFSFRFFVYPLYFLSALANRIC